MEILLNELSLDEQFNSLNEFIEKAAYKSLSFLEKLSDEDVLIKSRNFYTSKVTPNIAIYDALVGEHSRNSDIIRKFKTYLSRFLQGPYWENNQFHSNSTEYYFGNKLVTGKSIAEASCRDKVVFSFHHNDFFATQLNVSVGNKTTIIQNIGDGTQLLGIKIRFGLIYNFTLKDKTKFNKTNLERQGQMVYNEIATGSFWYLDNLHKNHYEVFDRNNIHLGVANLNGILDTNKKVKGRTL